MKKEIPNHIIRASAGTGKTFQLSNRYIELLAAGESCETILATTFTRKAAGEILDRIVQRLSIAALDEDAARELSPHINTDVDSTRCQEILVELMKQVHRLQIGTLDSFFGRIARSFSLELGLPLHWTVMDSESQLLGELSDQSVQELLSSKRAIELMHLLAKGETQRGVAALIRRTVNDVYNIHLDSQEEAWKRLDVSGPALTRDEINALIDQLEHAPANGAQQEKALAKDVGLARLREWKDFAHSTQLRRIVDGDKYGKKERSPVLEHAYTALFDFVRAWVNGELKRRNEATYGLVCEYAKQFMPKQREHGALRYDDVTLSLMDLIGRRDQNNNRLIFRLDQKINHLLLDEFQDTSPRQWHIIRQFAEQVTIKNSGRTFFCVGDVKQAIYGWRGGVAEIFEVVQEQLENLTPYPDMVQSYRSSQPVIDTVNQVFENLGSINREDQLVDSELKTASDNFKTHSTSREGLPGFVTMQYGADVPKAERKTNFNFRKNPLRNDLMLDQVVDEIKRYTINHPELSIGVLLRSNAQVGNTIFRLQREGIQASQEGGNYLTDSAAVETVLAAIQLADHPGDTVSRFLVSHSPLAAWFDLKPEATQNAEYNRQRVDVFATELRRDIINNGYGATVEQLAQVLASECTERELTRLQRLVELSYDYDDSWTTRVDQFVAYIREAKVPDESSANVRVMTVHGSKGLEFDVVFLPIMAKNNWIQPPRFVVDREHPASPASLVSLYVSRQLQEFLPDEFRDSFGREHQSRVREELCVLYVAMTRAVHAMHLHISYSGKHEDNSFAGILLSTLAPGKEREPQAVMYEKGDPDWIDQLDRSPAKVETLDQELQTFYLDPCMEILPCAISEEAKSGRSQSWSTPSRLEGGSKVQLSRVLQTRKDRSHLDRGILIHACFETISWLDKEEPSDDDLVASMKKANPLVTDMDIELALIDFREMLDRPLVKEMLTSTSYRDGATQRVLPATHTLLQPLETQFENERAFAVQTDSVMLEGFMDRVVWLYEGKQLLGAEVIDFKTDAVTEETLEVKIEFYRPQIGAYLSSIAEMSGLEPANIRGHLMFVQHNLRVEISDDRPPALFGEVSTRKKRVDSGSSENLRSPRASGDGQMRLW